MAQIPRPVDEDLISLFPGGSTGYNIFFQLAHG